MFALRLSLDMWTALAIVVALLVCMVSASAPSLAFEIVIARVVSCCCAFRLLLAFVRPLAVYHYIWCCVCLCCCCYSQLVNDIVFALVMSLYMCLSLSCILQLFLIGVCLACVMCLLICLCVCTVCAFCFFGLDMCLASCRASVYVCGFPLCVCGVCLDIDIVIYMSLGVFMSRVVRMFKALCSTFYVSASCLCS